MFGRSSGQRTRPLAPIVGRALPFLPLIAGLGLLASLLEGLGIGLFIPLVAILLSDALPSGLPRPVIELAAMLGGGDPHRRALLLGVAIFALIVLKGIVQAANDLLLSSVEGRIGQSLRNRLTGQLVNLDYPFFLTSDQSRLTRILSTDSWFVLEAVHSLLALIPAIAGVLVFGAMLAWLNLTLFLVVLAGGALVQLALFLAERRQERLSAAFTASNQAMWERFLTLVQAPRVVRLFGQQRREGERTEAAIDRLRRSVLATGRHTAFVQPILDATIALLFLVVLIAGYAGGMGIAAITAFLLLLARVQPHAKTIARARLSLATFHGSVREVEWLLSQQPQRRGDPGRDPVARLDRPIRFANVSFAYPNGNSALRGVDFTIEPGVATALVGKSGSGKTTIANLLCRLVEPQSGTILLDDRPIEQFNRDDWRSRIALAGQDSGLVIGTVAENIAYARPDATRAEIEEAAAAAGANNFIAALPQGYDTPVGAEGFDLSGGQRQRIALARALLRRPDLLILDEATNAVDAISEAEIMALVREHRYFHTMLVISHRKSTLESCQNGIILDDGTVVEAGPLASLDYYRKMAGGPPIDG